MNHGGIKVEGFLSLHHSFLKSKDSGLRVYIKSCILDFHLICRKFREILWSEKKRKKKKRTYLGRFKGTAPTNFSFSAEKYNSMFMQNNDQLLIVDSSSSQFPHNDNDSRTQSSHVPSIDGSFVIQWIQLCTRQDMQLNHVQKEGNDLKNLTPSGKFMIGIVDPKPWNLAWVSVFCRGLTFYLLFIFIIGRHIFLFFFLFFWFQLPNSSSTSLKQAIKEITKSLQYKLLGR